jgi:hypothetical protein
MLHSPSGGVTCGRQWCYQRPAIVLPAWSTPARFFTGANRQGAGGDGWWELPVCSSVGFHAMCAVFILSLRGIFSGDDGGKPQKLYVGHVVIAGGGGSEVPIPRGTLSMALFQRT